MSIKQLFDCRFSAGKIFNQLKSIDFNRIFIYRTVNILFHTNSCKDRPISSRPKSVRKKSASKLFNQQHSVNKMAPEE